MSGKMRSAVVIVVGVGVAIGALVWGMKGARTKAAAAEGAVCCPHDGPGTAVKNPVAGVTPGAAAGAEAQADAEAKARRSLLEVSEAEAEAERVVEPLQEALDSDDLKVVADAARKLMGHANRHVRLKAVEGLAWAENEGFADLSKMLLDADPEVSRAALEAWALQMQMIESTEVKAALLEEVGPVAIGMGAEAFQEIMDAMFDMPDAAALNLLQGYAAQTTDVEILETIIDAVNFYAQPEEAIETKEAIPGAIEEFRKREAEEAAEEAALQQGA